MPRAPPFAVCTPVTTKRGHTRQRFSQFNPKTAAFIAAKAPYTLSPKDPPMFDLNWFQLNTTALQGSDRTRYLCGRFDALGRAVKRLCEAGCNVELTVTGFRCAPAEGVVLFDEGEEDDPHTAIRLYLDKLGIAEPFEFPACSPTAAEYEAQYTALRDRPDVNAIFVAENDARFKEMLTGGRDHDGN
ncbi:MAG: HPF/RaiA family ribosome-associated protein [Planctomycetes bacterium]|nr:HPF/RaiA family ribosome-associated protein [Planctomycetota bacterium]